MNDSARKIRRWAIQLVLVGLVVSCNKKQSSKAARNELSRNESLYCSSDIRAAEKALIDHLETLSKEESNQVKGIDYDMAHAITHERLFLIYRKTQETNKMEIEFGKSMESLKRYTQRAGLPPPTNFTYEVLADKMERSERGLDVKWKKE